MSDIMLALGPYRFTVRRAAYQSLERTTAYTWARQERIGANDALQYTGPGPETMTLSGVVYPHHAGGLGQIDRMRRSAALGIPMPLIEGRGRVLGFWVISSISEGQTLFEQGGAALRQDFTLTLERYDGGLAAVMRL